MQDPQGIGTETTMQFDALARAGVDPKTVQIYHGFAKEIDNLEILAHAEAEQLRRELQPAYADAKVHTRLNAAADAIQSYEDKLISPRQNHLYLCAELTRPCLSEAGGTSNHAPRCHDGASTREMATYANSWGYDEPIRSAYVRTEVNKIMTLLVKSWRSISNVMGERFTRGMYSVSLAFKHQVQDRFLT